MKIQKVEIYNFRNFYGKHEFNLDKNITILYGENGYGKSTFFDAIEWCLTNQIERFKSQDGEDEFNNYDCVNNTAKNKIESECYVSIYYDNYRLFRRYNATTNRTSIILYGFINDKEVTIAQGQKNVERKLHKYKEDHESSGAKLIKHSYVLSQDQITNFIRSNPRERFDSLASIMGTNKITNFIDNLKVTNTFLQESYEKLNKELDNNRELILSHVKNREDFNILEKEIIELVKSLETIEVSGLGKDLNSIKIDAKMKTLDDELTTKKKIIDILSEIPEFFSKYNDLKVRLSTLEKEYTDKVNLVARAMESKNSANKSLKSIDSTFRNLIKEKDLLAEINDKRTIIGKTRDEINSTKLGKLSIEKLQYNLSSIRKKLELTDHTLLFMDDYKKAEDDYNRIPTKMTKQENKRNTIDRKIKSRKKLLLKIEKWLDENNASSTLKGLIQYLQGISDYVQNNDVQESCPVCSSHVGNGLETRIHKNITYHKSQITDLEQQIVKAYEIQDRTQNELNKFQHDKHEINLEIKNLKRLLNNASKTLKSTMENEKFDIVLFSENKNEIVKNKTKLKGEIKEIETLIEKKSALTSFENELHSMLENVNLKKSNIDVEKELEFKKKRIKRKLLRLDKLIDKSNKDMREINYERNKVSLYISNIDQLDDILLKEQNFYVLVNELNKKINVLDKDLTSMSKIKESIIIKDEKQEGLKKLISYENKRKKIKVDIEDLHTKIEELEKYIKDLTTEVGEQALDFLNHPHSKIQQYYRYLNPMPTTNGNIHFITENSDETKRGLSIAIPYKRENGENELMNARYTLSSAQLNTLAISIFLVANDSQDVGVFDFVAIDDPIQNMDDINQYTMCDILGDIKKQLLFSTHDLEFLKLFIKKNEYKKQDIRVYFLEAQNLQEGRVKEVTF